MSWLAYWFGGIILAVVVAKRTEKPDTEMAKKIHMRRKHYW